MSKKHLIPSAAIGLATLAVAVFGVPNISHADRTFQGGQWEGRHFHGDRSGRWVDPYDSRYGYSYEGDYYMPYDTYDNQYYCYDCGYRDYDGYYDGYGGFGFDLPFINGGGYIDF